MIRKNRQTRRRMLCAALAVVLLILSGCGRAEVESTILTIAAPETTATSETEATEPTTGETTAPMTQPTTEPLPAPSEDPTTEPMEEPTTGQGRDYVLNNNSKKFHFPDCGSAKQIKDSNREDYYGTREELLARGYSPCGRCKP